MSMTVAPLPQGLVVTITSVILSSAYIVYCHTTKIQQPRALADSIKITYTI